MQNKKTHNQVFCQNPTQTPHPQKKKKKRKEEEGGEEKKETTSSEMNVAPRCRHLRHMPVSCVEFSKVPDNDATLL